MKRRSALQVSAPDANAAWTLSLSLAYSHEQAYRVRKPPLSTPPLV